MMCMCVYVCGALRLALDRRKVKEELSQTHTHKHTHTRAHPLKYPNETTNWIEKLKRNISIRSNNEIERLLNTECVSVCMAMPLKLWADNNFTIDIMLCLEFPIQAFHQVNYFILFSLLFSERLCVKYEWVSEWVVVAAGEGFCAAKMSKQQQQQQQQLNEKTSPSIKQKSMLSSRRIAYVCVFARCLYRIKSTPLCNLAT